MTGGEIRYWSVTVLAILALAGAWLLLPMDEWLRGFAEWTAGLGLLGPLAFGGLFFLATLLVIPCTPLTIAGAVAFGWWAMPIALVSATAGSVLAFIASRYLFRERLRRLIARRPTMVATMEAVGDGGWRLLTLMRLSPFVPFNAQNYALGLTEVGMGAYLVSTILGMLPGTIVCVYLGIIGRAAGSDTTEHWLFLGLGFAATVAAVALTRRRVRHKMQARQAATAV